MNKKTREHLQHQKAVFCSANSITTLSRLLGTDQRKLKLLVEQPRYKTFSRPKKDGGERQIEAPGADLKRVLNRLNRYLQSVYFFEKSHAAFGFITGVRNDDDRRNILTNARKHMGKEYLLNVDLQDFFHSVTKDKVLQIFMEKPFRFKHEVCELLADLTTFQGRLPMGTSTSPVLSNFACRALDQELQAFADHLLWTYTRYADDMTFSGNRYINAEMKNSLRGIIEKAGFKINERKMKLYGPKDEKIVTGLLVSNKVTLAADYLPLIKEEIERLKGILIAQNEQGQLSTRWVEEFKQQIKGRLSFAGFVLKRDHPDYIALQDAYYVAVNPPQEEFSAVSWRGFPYNL